MHVIQVSVKSWLVLDTMPQPRWLIVRAAMVHKATGETHIVHRVEHWNHVPASRWVVAVCESEWAARKWCEAQLEAEARAEERRRKEPLRDPATGLLIKPGVRGQA